MDGLSELVENIIESAKSDDWNIKHNAYIALVEWVADKSHKEWEEGYKAGRETGRICSVG